MFKKVLFQKREVRMMNKQRFSVVYEKFTSKDILPKGIMDNKKNNHMCRIEEVCDLLNEQQTTIHKLQDLCGESDSENAKLRIENKRLQEENEALKKFIKDNFNKMMDSKMVIENE